MWRVLRNSDVSALSIAIDSGKDILLFLFTYVLLWELRRVDSVINVFMYSCIQLVPTEFNLLKNNLILNILLFAYNLLLTSTNSYAFLPCKIWLGVPYQHLGKWVKIFYLKLEESQCMYRISQKWWWVNIMSTKYQPSRGPSTEAVLARQVGSCLGDSFCIPITCSTR